LKYLNILFLLVILVTTLNADIEMSCAGARAAGMGGAFIGVSDDATAVFWNPSGLTQLQNLEVSIVTKYNSLKSQFVGWENEQSNFVLDFVSFAYPFMDNKLVIAATYQRPMDLYLDFEVDYGSVHEIEEGTGGADTFTMGLAYRINSIFSAGLSANTWFGEIEREYYYNENDYSVSWGEWYDYTAIYKFNQTFSGFNMIIGGLIDLNYLENSIPFKIGAVCRTAFDLKAKEKGLISYDEIWEQGVHYYSVEVIDGHVKNEIPVMIGIGASYCFGEYFTLAADFEKRAYKNSNINQHEKDLNQFRIGAEYLIVTNFAEIPIRAGFQTVPTLMVDAFNNQIIGSGYSFGTGLSFDKFAIDIAFTKAKNENDRGYYGTQDNSYTKFIFSGIYYF
jgi:hypothetical protein